MNAQSQLRLAMTVILIILGSRQVGAMEPLALKLPRPMVVSGVYLQASAYDVQWKLQGKHATVVFSRQGQTIATVHGEVMTLDLLSHHTTFYFSKAADGACTIQALGFARSHKAIVFSQIRPRPNSQSSAPAENSFAGNDVPDPVSKPPRFPR